MVHLGLFLVALATLALEIAMSRLLSVMTWYYLAFFAVATAMLGMTAGATTVYLKPALYTPERLMDSVARSTLHFALATPAVLILLCLTPLGEPTTLMGACALFVVAVACSLPYYFAGTAVTALLTSSRFPTAGLYAVDLLGASVGCLAVVGGLEIVDAPGLIVLCGSVAALGAASFFWRRSTRLLLWSLGTAAALVLVALLTSPTHSIRPVVVKGRLESNSYWIEERWNSFSRIKVSGLLNEAPPYWGASPLAPQTPVAQHFMHIDGEAGTTVCEFTSKSGIDHLRFDVTNVAHYLRPRGRACVIGVGGGRDIQAALLFGHEHVTGVEVNPIFVELLQGRFKDFAHIGDRPDVTLVVDEARSHLSRSREQFTVLQMSLVDTWAATGAGAFSLSENALYTTEAWAVFLKRLTDDGIFTLSRWFGAGDAGETGRSLSLAVATLLEAGVSDPARHIAMVTSRSVATLLVSRQPFSAEDISTLENTCSTLQYTVQMRPGAPPSHPALQRIAASRSQDELRTATAGLSLNYSPPTDESPYFFNMLRLRGIPQAFDAFPGVIRGNLDATLTLITLLLVLGTLCGVTVVLPLWLKARSEHRSTSFSGVRWRHASYFCLIGAGFMLLEMGLLQRLSVFLGHPVYALGVLLFSIIASAGLGSLISGVLPVRRRLPVLLYPLVTAAAILVAQLTLPKLAAAMIASSIPLKIVASIAFIFPLGMLLGGFFPTGMRLLREAGDEEAPWYWALNGILGVLCSAVAVFNAIYFGISTNFYLAAVCYALLVICLLDMLRSRPEPGAR